MRGKTSPIPRAPATGGVNGFGQRYGCGNVNVPYIDVGLADTTIVDRLVFLRHPILKQKNNHGTDNHQNIGMRAAEVPS